MTLALCTATISLSALRNNLEQVKKCASNSKILTVLKANAYGHGMLETAKALAASDVFAVARIEEAIKLRAISNKPIIILSGVLGGDAVQACRENGIQPVIHSLTSWHFIKQHAPDLDYWLKVDSGMHRLGLSKEEFTQIAQQRDKHCQGLLSHLSDAECDDKTQTQLQLERFNELHQLWPELPCSLANSAGILFHPSSHFDWVRPGIMLYGMNPANTETATSQKLQAVMRFNTKVVAIHDIPAGESVGYNGRWQANKASRIATLAAGYADGYPRHAKDGTPVWINGAYYPLAGKVSMDLITVDVTGANVQLGDTAELWGEHVSASTVAEYADTISYDLFTGVSQRVPRIYCE